MKQIVFRPLRREKKTGRVIVASNPQWRKIMNTDTWQEFELIIDDEYKQMPADERVHDHKGEPLFFYTYHPADVPVFTHNVLFDLEEIRANHAQYGIDWGSGFPVNYRMDGTDCDGIPSFTIYNEERVSQSSDWHRLEPLTVETVVKWFGWFLYRLEKSYLQIGR